MTYRSTGVEENGEDMGWFLALLLLAVYAVCGGISGKIAENRGLNYTPYFALGLLLGPLGILITAVLANSSLPKEADPDSILKYKQLFDQGVITADEFEQKKKELLGN
ncbi:MULTISPECIES: SHOCT domain-containing protein [unclassified Collinsella]|uniref:SHOCT domain-containing protein n=1 Tax=unclassified Collinsella TaxID=2637548 RepID=UPI00319E382B